MVENKEYWRNDMNANAISGSELMMKNLEKSLGSEFLKDFHFTLSRQRGELPEDKFRIFYAHDLPTDPESVKALDCGNWRNFHKIVFVSNWQQQHFIEKFQIPWSRTIVMPNAIKEIDVDLTEKFELPKNKVKFIYHTTPHRGLGILVPVFQKLAEEFPNKVHLDVYSSFKIYGWEDRDKQFEPLYNTIREHKDMTYLGTVSNDKVRKALAKADIFAYPSVWTETSCLSLIEAMSAGCLCIHPNLGALYETAGNWTFMYPFQEDPNIHASHFYEMLAHGTKLLLKMPKSLKLKLMGQKSYTDVTYSWEVRSVAWKGMLDSLRSLPRGFETSMPPDDKPEGTFNYTVDI